MNDFSQPPSPPSPPPQQNLMPLRVEDVIFTVLAVLITGLLILPVLIGALLVMFLGLDPTQAEQVFQGGNPALARTVILLVLFASALATFLIIKGYIINFRNVSWHQLGLFPIDREKVKILLREAFLLAIFSLLLSMLIGAVMDFLFNGLEENPQLEGLQFVFTSLPSTILFFILTCVLVPFAEELLFRGLLYGWIRERFGFRHAIIISSLVFAAAHFYLQLLPGLFALSLVLGYFYEIRRTIWAPIFLHGFFNAINLIIFFVAKGSGM